MIYTAVDQKPKCGTALKRLRNVGENPMVTMLADHYSDDWERCGGFAPTAGRRSWRISGRWRHR
jgi:hypothetical protein